jgi:hypothetical protein
MKKYVELHQELDGEKESERFKNLQNGVEKKILRDILKLAGILKN